MYQKRKKYGHIFYKYQYYGYDDAIYASLKIINLLSKSDQKLSDIIEPYIKSNSTPEIKLYCDEKDKFQILSNIIDEIRTTYTNDVDIIDIDGVRVESNSFCLLDLHPHSPLVGLKGWQADHSYGLWLFFLHVRYKIRWSGEYFILYIRVGGINP